MVLAMPVRIYIVEMWPVECTTLAIYIHMQMQPAYLHSQQTEAHGDNE